MYRGGWTVEYTLGNDRMVNPRYSVWGIDDASYRLFDKQVKDLISSFRI